jgi:hypothetical protein
MHGFYARTGPILSHSAGVGVGARLKSAKIRCRDIRKGLIWKGLAMRLTIEILAAALLLFCISASSAAFAAGKSGKSADGLSCALSVPANASSAARCAAIKRQCGGKFFANYCGDRLLSAM